MPRTPEQYEAIRNAKKKVIIDAALKLFAEKGFVATTINQIAEAADIANGLMYRHFKSKEELLKSVVLTVANEIDEMLAPSHNNAMSREDALQFFDKFFDMLMTRTEVAKLFTQLVYQPEVIKIISDNSILPHMSKRGETIYSYLSETHKENAQMTLLNIAAITNGIMLLYAFSPNDFPDEMMLQYRDYLKKMFIPM
jgi:AcrR family transcriptional regulator